jgi:tetratricopeptide (TPR) repeat protein
MKKILMRLEEFREALARTLPGAKLATNKPTIVVVFKDDDAFHPYKPQFKGKTEDNVRGYFQERADSNFIVLSTDSSAIAPFDVIFHEYEHFVLGNNMKKAPLWLNEGFAEYYSTFEASDKENKIMVGGPIGRHIGLLRYKPLLPLKTLLSVNSKSPEYHEGSKVGMFYAESWALVHYLMNGNELKRRPQLIRFINQLSTDAPLDENFRQSFGQDYGQMEQELRSYVAKFLFPVMNTKFLNGFTFDKQTTVTPLTEPQKFAYLGDLLAGVRRFKDAEEKLRKAIQSDPTFGPAKVSLAQVLAAQDRYPEAEEVLTSALKDGSKDYLTSYYLGVYLYQSRKYDEALTSFQKSLEYRSNNARAYTMMGQVYTVLNQYDRAIEAYRNSLRIEPDDGTVFHALSYLKLNQADGALAAAFAMTFLRDEGWQARASPYMAIVAVLGYKMAHKPERVEAVLASAFSRLDSTDWAYSILQYLKGQIDDEALLKLAIDDGKQTEAHAYIGLNLSILGKKGDAIRHLEWVRDNGKHTFDEYPLSLAELTRLQKIPESVVK